MAKDGRIGRIPIQQKLCGVDKIGRDGILRKRLHHSTSVHHLEPGLGKMLLNRVDCRRLVSLTEVLRKEWGISVGYSCPLGSFIKSDDNFIIYEIRINKLNREEDGEHNWAPQLIHSADLTSEQSEFMCTKTPRFPLQHEAEVEAFWKKFKSLDAII